MVKSFLETGVNGLYPLELVAGTDPIATSRGPDAIDKAMVKVTSLMEQDRYVPFTGHRVPSEVTLTNFKIKVK